jgi:uncharacterized membrane protein YkvA (DUF1232 family)
LRSPSGEVPGRGKNSSAQSTARGATTSTLDADVSSLHWLLVVAACLLLVYAGLVVALVVAGRRGSARDLARFIPDCIVLLRRLLGDPRVPQRHKLLLGVVVGYLAVPFDLVPDFIPVAGHVDDALVVVLALRAVLRGSGSDLLREHWRGSENSLAIVLRFAGAPSSGRATNDAVTASTQRLDGEPPSSPP